MKFPKKAAPMNEGISAANYLKIGDGQSVTGVPRGEVFEFFQKWPQGGQKEVFLVPTSGATPRYKINVVVHEDGKFAAKVFEFGTSVYNQFAEIADNFDMEKTKIKISRKGSGKNTEWFILPLGAVEPKALKSIALVELNSFAPKVDDAGDTGKTPWSGSDDETGGASGVPF